MYLLRPNIQMVIFAKLIHSHQRTIKAVLHGEDLQQKLFSLAETHNITRFGPIWWCDLTTCPCPCYPQWNDHELFMNGSWTIHEHEMAKFMKLVRFMNLEFINLSSWTCEFMNSSWTIVHDLFMNNFQEWYMNSSWTIVHDLFMNNFQEWYMNSSWIVQE